MTDRRAQHCTSLLVLLYRTGWMQDSNNDSLFWTNSGQKERMRWEPAELQLRALGVNNDSHHSCTPPSPGTGPCSMP
jgi:hypothetical protein